MTTTLRNGERNLTLRIPEHMHRFIKMQSVAAGLTLREHLTHVLIKATKYEPIEDIQFGKQQKGAR